MKKTSLFLGIFLTVACSAFAAQNAMKPAKASSAPPAFYSQIAPLVDEETAFVARLNLERVDFDALTQTLLADSKTERVRIGFDDVSQVRIGAALEKGIADASSPTERRIRCL